MNASLERGARAEIELLALGVSAGAAVCGWAWTAKGLPLPQCAFRAMTGCPCPTCGATRCAMALIHGHLWEALAWNPLVFAAIGGIAALNLYSAGVVLAGWPRLRVTLSTYRARILGVVGFLVLLGNWAYEIHRQMQTIPRSL